MSNEVFLKLLSYVTGNYTWIIIGIIILLLTIIGRYADKTNFGEGKKIVKVKKQKEDLVDKLDVPKEDLVDNLDVQKEVVVEKQDEPATNDIDEMLNGSKIEKEEINDQTPNLTVDLVDEEKKEDDQDLTLDEFLKTDDLDVLLPEKNSFNDNLLQEIDDINFEFKNKDKDKDTVVPDLDDVALPNIKKKRKTTDIWK